MTAASSLHARSDPLRWQGGPVGGVDWMATGAVDESAPVFWGHYLQRLGTLWEARRVLLLGATVGQPWQALAQWPADAGALPHDARYVQQALETLLSDRPQLARLPSGGAILALRLPQAPAANEQVLAVVALRDRDWPDEGQGWLAWAGLAAAVPAWWAQLMALRASRKAAQAQAVAEHRPHEPGQAADNADEPMQRVVQRAERLHGLMQLVNRLWSQDRFVRQAFELCSELAQQHACDRVSLGWRVGPYIRLQAISQIEAFDPRANAVRALESAMEEAAEQPTDICHPQEGAVLVARAHADYARLQGTQHLLSVPLRRGDEVCGVLTLERNGEPFDQNERWELAELALLAVYPMAHLHERDRWWGARMGRGVWRSLQFWVGPKHTAWKLAIGSLVLGAIGAVLTPWDYRVEAAVNLRSKDVLFMPAPFDGYLREVHVEVGERVETGQLLASLDTRDLVLEASMAAADLARHAREAEKAQAARQFADMQITLARQQQAASRLALIEHQLAQARVLAPHEGIVVEGDLKKNLGAPLRKGDLLLKLAQTGEIVVDIAIDEADVHEVQPGSRGEFALVGRPDQRFALRIERIDPVATLRDGQNVFLARAQFAGVVPDWWRPGMGGTARIDVGERSLLWVMTHRTVRFLRKVFWL
jgi:hypothetical protein